MNKRMVGSLNEDKAVEYLESKGFNIIIRNYKCKIGEIDIIATKNNILRFIEVKYRKNSHFGDAVESVSKKKQSKISKCASWYMVENEIDPESCCSFDVVAINDQMIQYYFNAYNTI